MWNLESSTLEGRQLEAVYSHIQDSPAWVMGFERGS